MLGRPDLLAAVFVDLLDLSVLAPHPLGPLAAFLERVLLVLLAELGEAPPADEGLTDSHRHVSPDFEDGVRELGLG